LNGADATGATFRGCDFTDTKIEYVILNECRFEQSNFFNAEISYSELKQAVFDIANLTKAVFRQNELESATFNEAILNTTMFEGVLNGVKLGGARLDGVLLTLASVSCGFMSMGETVQVEKDDVICTKCRTKVDEHASSVLPIANSKILGAVASFKSLFVK